MEAKRANLIYLNPPSQWIPAAPESPELLSLCLKRVRGLSKGLRVRGAKFIWTEPHSRRINLEVTVHGELPTGDMVEQELPLEFVVHPQQCPDCCRAAANDFWNSCVQVRQKADHKRTLLHLEQIILKSNAHKECNNIKYAGTGVDFYFQTRAHAMTFVNFLYKRVPCSRCVTSQHLKSHDVNNNTYNYKFTFAIEVAGVCKNDIVCLSKAQSQRLSGIGQLCIVTKVAESIHLIDPVTCQVCRVDGTGFFSSPFASIASQKCFSSYVVLEIEDEDDGKRGNHTTTVATTSGARKGRNSKKGGGPPPAKRANKLMTTTIGPRAPVGAQISKRHRTVSLWLMRLNNDETVHGSTGNTDGDDGMIHARTHLGHVIRVGDTVRGLDLRTYNVNHKEFDKLSEKELPDVILVTRPRQSTEDDQGSKASRRKKIRQRGKRRFSTTLTGKEEEATTTSTMGEDDSETVDLSSDDDDDEEDDDYDDEADIIDAKPHIPFEMMECSGDEDLDDEPEEFVRFI